MSLDSIRRVHPHPTQSSVYGYPIFRIPRSILITIYCHYRSIISINIVIIIVTTTTIITTLYHYYYRLSSLIIFTAGIVTPASTTAIMVAVAYRCYRHRSLFFYFSAFHHNRNCR